MFKFQLPQFAFKNLLVISLITGILLGAFAAVGFKIDQSVEILMSQLGLYVAIPSIFGYLAMRRRDAIIFATLVLVIMSVVYVIPYADTVSMVFFNSLIWVILSLMSGPVFGFIGFSARSTSIVSIIGVSAIIGLLLGEFIRMTQKGVIQGDLDVLFLSLLFNLIFIVIILAAIKKELLIKVLLFSIPMTVVGYAVTFVLR